MSSSFVRIRAVLGFVALAAMLGMAAVPLAAQATGTIRGKVVEAGTQRPLNGVQVVVDGTTRGALTNAAGEYTVANVPTGSHTVRASMVGFSTAAQTVNLTAAEPATLNFTLSQSAISLDALVVTGTPGATQKRAIGNSVTTVSAAEVTEKTPIANVAQLLQARTPGLTLMQASGSPGTATSIRLRGTGSISAGVNPVFYVDGVRIMSGGQGGQSVSGQRTSALDIISPEDIESIEVIKGPAAATLYGADAAAGVIQIITKKGKMGQQGIQWNAKVGYGQQDWALEKPTNYSYCSDARITGTGEKGKAGYIPAPNSGETGAYPGCANISTSLDPLSPERIISANMLRDDPRALRTGETKNFSLSARGGGERFSYFVSGDRDEEQSIFQNGGFDRTTGRANFKIEANKQLDFSLNLSYGRTNTQLPNNDNSSWGILRNAWRSPAGYMGTFEQNYLGLAPPQIAQYENMTRAERFIFGGTVNYQPFDWFKNRLTVGMDAGERLATAFIPIDNTGKAPYGASNAQGYIDQYAPRTRQRTLDYSGTLTHDFTSSLSSDFSFGAQLNAYRFESFNAWGEGLVSNKVRLVRNAATNHGDESFSEQNSLGFFAQEQLGWQNKLFVTGAVRMDNNSAFGSDIKRVFYPKLSASYVISDEDWFNVPAFDNLRLRAAWGRAGNSPAPFAADRTWGTASLVNVDGSLAPALISRAYGNTNLKAETGDEYELGFEGSLLGGRAGVDFTFYNKNTYDAIVPISVAPSSGYGQANYRSVQTNVGDINNKGIEFSVFGTPVQSRALTWETRLGLSTNHNEMVSFNGGRTDPILVGYRSSQRIDEGYPIAGFWGWDVKRDADGKPLLDKTGNVMPGDTSFVGSSTPTRELGFSNTFTVFGNLSLYVFADYKGGHYQFNMTQQTRDQGKLTRETVDPSIDPLEWKAIQAGPTIGYMSKADFVKLREVSLTYTLPRTFAKRMGAEDLSLSLAGRNLGIWTKYEGADPEVNIEGDDNLVRADYMSVPATRRLSATLNVRF